MLVPEGCAPTSRLVILRHAAACSGGEVEFHGVSGRLCQSWSRSKAAVGLRVGLRAWGGPSTTTGSAGRLRWPPCWSHRYHRSSSTQAVSDFCAARVGRGRNLPIVASRANDAGRSRRGSPTVSYVGRLGKIFMRGAHDSVRVPREKRSRSGNDPNEITTDTRSLERHRTSCAPSLWGLGHGDRVSEEPWHIRREYGTMSRPRTWITFATQPGWYTNCSVSTATCQRASPMTEGPAKSAR